MTLYQHNIIVVLMIPAFIDIGSPWKVLPPGIHLATLSDVQTRFAISDHRKLLFQGLKQGIQSLSSSGCKRVLLDGSYVTDKPYPKDYDVCWDPTYVDENKLEEIFLNCTVEGRKKQKERYLGEFFPMLARASSNEVFAQYFQVDKYTGSLKGIIGLDL